MASGSLKLYHEEHLDVPTFLSHYFAATADEVIQEESYKFPVRKLLHDLSAGDIQGDTLIDISTGPNISHLMPISEYFKEITILELNQGIVKELEKWKNKDPDACDWSHVSSFYAELEGKSPHWEEKEDKVRRTIKHILPCDLTKENPTDPVVLPKADCILSVWSLGILCKDQVTYLSNLKNISSMLKVGGQMVIFGAFNASFYKVGEKKYHAFNMNEEFLKKALKETGYTIKGYEIIERLSTVDLADHDTLYYINAFKEKEI